MTILDQILSVVNRGISQARDRQAALEEGDQQGEAERQEEQGEATMSLKQWENNVLEAPGADERVREIEDELRLAAGQSFKTLEIASREPLIDRILDYIVTHLVMDITTRVGFGEMDS